MYRNSPFSLLSQSQITDSRNFTLTYSQDHDSYQISRKGTHKSFSFERYGGLYAYIGEDLCRSHINPPSGIDNMTSIKVMGCMIKKSSDQDLEIGSVFRNPGNLSNAAMQRVAVLRKVHKFCHSKKESLSNMIKYYSNTVQKSPIAHITLDDLDNYFTILPDCDSCSVGFMNKNENVSVKGNRKDIVGWEVACDVVPFNHDDKDTTFQFFTVDTFCGFILTYPLKSKHAEVMCEDSVDLLLRDYRQGGHTITTLASDREKNIHAMTCLPDNGIHLIQTGPEQHCNKVERAIQDIKNRCMAIYNSLNPDVNYEFLYTHLFQWACSAHNAMPIYIGGKLDTPFRCFYGFDVSLTLMERHFGEYVMALVPNRKSKSDDKAEPMLIIGMDMSSVDVFLCYCCRRNNFHWRTSLYFPLKNSPPYLLSS